MSETDTDQIVRVVLSRLSDELRRASESLPVSAPACPEPAHTATVATPTDERRARHRNELIARLRRA